MFSEAPIMRGKRIRTPKSEKFRMKRKPGRALMHIGTQLMHLRQMRAVSIAMLSRETGVGVSAIRSMEKYGKGNFKTYNALLKYLGGTMMIIPLPAPSWVDGSARAIEMVIKSIKPAGDNEFDEDDLKELEKTYEDHERIIS